MLNHGLNHSYSEFEPQGQATDSAVAGSAWNAPASGASRPDRSGCCGRSVRQCERQTTGYQPQDRDVVAWPVRGARHGESVGGSAGSRTQAHVWTGKDKSDRGCDSADQAQGNDAVELPTHGGEPGGKQVHRQQHLAQPQSQAPPGQELQAVARSPISGEAHGCGWFVFESSPADHGAVRGREEPDSGVGPHATRPDPEEGALRHHDARLQAQWHYYAVCCLGSSAGPGHRPMLRAAPPSGVSEISAAAGPGVSWRGPLAPGDGQLWHSQTSQGSSVDQTASPLHPSLCADQFQLAQYGRALVWRTDLQESAAGLVLQRERSTKCNHGVPGGLE